MIKTPRAVEERTFNEKLDAMTGPEKWYAYMT